VATVQFSRAVREGYARDAGTMAGDGRRGLSKLNSMHGLELGVVPRTARGGAAGRVSGAAAGPARSGRHARPHGRSADPADRSRPKWRAGRAAPCRTGTILVLPRKEVIQPHLPVRLPCYDFTPVTSPTFDGSLPCGLGHRLRVLLTPVV
jgi:hypothetical protein